MAAIHIHKTIDSESLYLPELRPLIGKMVEIIVTEVVPPTRDCLKALEVAPAPLDRQALDAMRKQLTADQYDALVAIATAGGPDVEAIRRLRAASMT